MVAVNGDKFYRWWKVVVEIIKDGSWWWKLLVVMGNDGHYQWWQTMKFRNVCEFTIGQKWNDKSDGPKWIVREGGSFTLSYNSFLSYPSVFS